MSLGFIALSAVIGVLSSLTIPEIDERLDVWQWRVGIGIAAFLVVQFLILTPMRMWKDATWITNIEAALGALWNLHDEGVRLLNAHHRQEEEHPGSLQEEAAKAVWVQQWIESEQEWRLRLADAIRDVSPPEERSLRNVITVEVTLEGLNGQHTLYLNILRVRLERTGAMLRMHHPALLPE